MSPRHLPLEVDWVERPLTITVEGQTVTGIARANWGGIEVSITGPIAYLTRSYDGRGWALAMKAHHCPEARFAFGGEFTVKGHKTAESVLAGMYLDWLAVSHHQAEVDAECRRTQQRLNDLERQFVAHQRPLLQKRQALRGAFRAGEISQREYQRLRKEVQKQMDQLDWERRRAELVAQSEFATWMQGCCGREISFDCAESLLLEAAVVVIVRQTGSSIRDAQRTVLEK